MLRTPWTCRASCSKLSSISGSTPSSMRPNTDLAESYTIFAETPDVVLKD